MAYFEQPAIVRRSGGRLTSITEACSSQTVLDMVMSESLAVRSAKISSIGGCLRARVVRLSSTTHGEP